MNTKEEIRIIGIDPGTAFTGYGIISVVEKKPVLLEYGEFRLNKLNGHPMKLKHIFERTLKLIDHHHPDELAIEAPFYGKNVQSMLKLGRAQGVAMAAALYRNIPIFEYSPRKIKQSITGRGNAAKEQVAGLLSQILGVNFDQSSLDATDGIAAALCHYYQRNTPGQGSRSSWSQFIKDNPGRIK